MRGDKEIPLFLRTQHWACISISQFQSELGVEANSLIHSTHQFAEPTHKEWTESTDAKIEEATTAQRSG